MAECSAGGAELQDSFQSPALALAPAALCSSAGEIQPMVCRRQLSLCWGMNTQWFGEKNSDLRVRDSGELVLSASGWCCFCLCPGSCSMGYGPAESIPGWTDSPGVGGQCRGKRWREEQSLGFLLGDASSLCWGCRDGNAWGELVELGLFPLLPFRSLCGELMPWGV